MFHKNSVKSTLFLVILWFHEFFSTLCTQRGSYVRKYTLSHLAKISWNQRKKLLNSWFDAIFFHTLYIAFRSAQCTFFEKNSVKLTKLHFSCFQEIFCESKFLVFRYCNATCIATTVLIFWLRIQWRHWLWMWNHLLQND